MKQNRTISAISIVSLALTLVGMGVSRAQATEAAKSRLVSASLVKTTQSTHPRLVRLGPQYFKSSENQHLTLSGQGFSCVTDSLGCKDIHSLKYMPIFVDLAKAPLATFSGGGHLGRFSMGVGNTIAGVAGLVALAAVIVYFLPEAAIGATARMLITKAGVGSGGVAGAVTACQNLLKKCK